MYVLLVSKGQGFSFILGKKKQEPVSHSINFKQKYKLFLALNVFFSISGYRVSTNTTDYTRKLLVTQLQLLSRRHSILPRRRLLGIPRKRPSLARPAQLSTLAEEDNSVNGL